MQVSSDLMKVFTFIGCSVLTAGTFSFVSYVLGWCVAKEMFNNPDDKEIIKTAMIVVLVVLISVVLSTLIVLGSN